MQTAKIENTKPKQQQKNDMGLCKIISKLDFDFSGNLTSCGVQLGHVTPHPQIQHFNSSFQLM